MLAKRFEHILHDLGMAGLEHPLFYHAPVGIRFKIGGEEPIYLDRRAAKLKTNPAYVQGALDRAAAIYRALPAVPDLLRIDGYPDEEPADNEEELSPAEIQAAVEDWRDQILAAISQPNQPHYTPWPEDNERPYYTDKPDWDAFGAMLLVAACHTYEEPVPLTVEKDWIFGEHPLVARLASDEERVWSLFRGATWWLPLSDSFLFQGSLPTDDTAAIATLGGLRKELEKLNQLAWQADEDTILGWADTEGYPVDGTVDSDGQYSKADIPEHTQYDTQSLAKFAFSMFWRAMRFAEEQQVPILLDY